MPPPRLDSNERRLAILDAAMPLFAAKGFAATTTREIAQAAGVSEALIFKHFPSKYALYEAMFTVCLEGDEEFARLMVLPPCSRTLVEFIAGLVRYFVIEVPAIPAELARHRLIVTSFLEDGEFAHQVFVWTAQHIHPNVEASIGAAAACGDLTPLPAADCGCHSQAVWFAHLFSSVLATVCLPGRKLVPYACSDADVGRQAAWFILRGLGLKDSVIAACAAEGLLSMSPPATPSSSDTPSQRGQP